MEVITMESSAFKMLTEQIADVAKLVALIYSNARENTKSKKDGTCADQAVMQQEYLGKQANPAANAL